jgi:tetraacyldisaccharide 4'-kinase
MSPASSLAKVFLAVPAAGYHVVQSMRAKAFSLGLLKSDAAQVPVISVGNVLLGGSGKTPFAIFLAQLLRNSGLKPAVVSRGYKGRYRDAYCVVSKGIPGQEGELTGPELCGDEPFLMSKRLDRVPVIVGRKRIHPVQAADDLFSCNIVVLDDGFQHLQLKRDVDIVLLNGSEDRMFPAGLLREPISALRRAHVVVLVGSSAQLPQSAIPYLSTVPVFRCRHRAVGLHQGFSSALIPPDHFADRPVFLASAIAHPQRFRLTAEDLSWKIIDHRIFPDHHPFSDRDLEDLLGIAANEPVVVTEKDWVKLPDWVKRTGRVWALRIDVAMDDEAAFCRVLLGLIEKR